MRRREFIAGLGSVAAWPLAARAQQQALPVVGFVNVGPADHSLAPAFRKGLGETGYVEGQNVTVEYHWLEGQYDRVPALVAELVRRRVAVIAAPGGTPASIRLRQRRSRSSLASAKTRSSLVLSPASRGRAATRPVSIFSPRS
jgi:putative ABC transport system substrate-binding protein